MIIHLCHRFHAFAFELYLMLSSRIKFLNYLFSDKGLWISAEMVPSVLSFLAKVASEPLMKDWLGGHEGNIFWPSLLTMLCNTPIQSATAPPSVPREGVSDAAYVAAIYSLL